jgi:short subunit dehydrogenase-like uncharacterized protein
MHIAVTHAGPGTSQTMLEGARLGGRVRREGRLVPHPLGAGSQEIPFADRTRRASPLPLGDLEAAWMDTRLPNITVYGTALPGGFFQRWAIAVARRLLWIPIVRSALASVREGSREDRHCQAWARATNARGESAEAWLQTGEGFAFTAAASVRAVMHLRRSPPPGSHAAVTALGASFAESIPEVRVRASRSRLPSPAGAIGPAIASE